MEHLLCLYSRCIQRGRRLTRESISAKTKALESSCKSLILSHPYFLSISKFFCLCLQNICRIWPYPPVQATQISSALTGNPVILFLFLPSFLYPAVSPVNVDHIVTSLLTTIQWSSLCHSEYNPNYHGPQGSNDYHRVLASPSPSSPGSYHQAKHAPFLDLCTDCLFACLECFFSDLCRSEWSSQPLWNSTFHHPLPPLHSLFLHRIFHHWTY